MTAVLTHALTAVLAAAAAWTAGWHARHRLGPRRTWACARCDQAAVRAELDRLTAELSDYDKRAHQQQNRAETAEAALTRVRAVAQKFASAQYGVDADADGVRRTAARELLTALGEPTAPAPLVDRPPTSHRLRSTPVDLHTWDGTHNPATTAWLAGHPHTWDGQQLVIHNPDDPTAGTERRPEPGWTLARFPDGTVTVNSPRSAARLFEAVEPPAPFVDRPFTSHRTPQEH